MKQRRALLKLMGAGAGTCLVTPPVSAGLITSATPKLPQYDSLLGGLTRTADLMGKRIAYNWTYSGPNLAGAPLVFGLPLEEIPSLEWLLKVVDVILKLVGNFLAALARQMDPAHAGELGALQQQIDTMQRTFTEVNDRHQQLLAAHAGQTSADLGTLTEVALLQQRVQGALAQLPAMWANATALVQGRLSSPQGLGDFSDKDSLARFDALFVTMPMPDMAKEWHSDEVFAHLRVAGPNPMLIKRVDGALPAKFPLQDSQYRQVMGNDDSLAEAVADKRLYILDYVQLGGMAPAGVTNKLLTGASYNTAPIALFAVPKGGKALMPVAIQCGQDAQANPMFLRPKPGNTAAFWSWQMAKNVVQAADFNYHEMFVHLGRTHLVSEAFCVATQRCLAPSHPLHVLLVPHFEGDLWINLLAALTIMAPGTFGDVIEGPPLKAMQSGAVQNRLAFDFYASMPTEDFRARGVDDATSLPEYPYRDDALLLWDAISQWVRDYIGLYYRSDSDVVNDNELKAWVQEVINKGKIKGFRPITSIAQLTSVITMVIFTASAQHAAVNFPQQTVMTYPPLSAAVSRTPPPTQTSGAAQADWSRQLPGALVTLAQYNFLQVLGGVHYRPLGEYRRNRFPYAPALTDTRVAPLLQRFKDKLAQIESTIQARNTQRSRPYPHLLPSRIPTSTNI
jgi:arachidonate 15-lipoxygenase